MSQTVDASRGVTLINVFTVEPKNQQRVVDLLTRATEDFVSHAPGFISATLHRSTDGTKVTMVAQWRSAEDYQAMRRDPGPLPFLEEALTIGRARDVRGCAQVRTRATSEMIVDHARRDLRAKHRGFWMGWRVWRSCDLQAPVALFVPSATTTRARFVCSNLSLPTSG